jgi:formate dehydrogenase subunit gamma
MLRPGNAIDRYNYLERVVHWMLTICFFAAGLSGLAFFHPSMFWLTHFFGGGPWTRILHPFMGLGMFLFFAWLGLKVIGHNTIDKTDVEWLRHAHEVMAGDESGAPPAGKYNAGQKVLFWLLTLCMLGLLVTGLCFWRPLADGLPVTLIRWASLLHAVCATGLILLVIGHAYMAFWTKESIRAMVQGWVTPAWAKSNHPAWHDEVMRKN